MNSRYEIERNELLSSLAAGTEDLNLDEAELYEWAATDGLRGVGRGVVAAVRRTLNSVSSETGDNAREAVRHLGHWFRKAGGVPQQTIDEWYAQGGLMRVIDGVYETHKRIIKRIKINQDAEAEELFDALQPLLAKADISVTEVKRAYDKDGYEGVVSLIKTRAG